MRREYQLQPKLHYFLYSMLFLSTNSIALPFSLVPNGALPTTVTAGSTVSASYIITNRTGITLNNNIIRTPPNVASNGCSPSLNLAPNGSCTLSLTISGEVNRDDPNSANHLYACLQDDITCAGPTPANSLNVTVIPVVPPTDSSRLIGVGGASISGFGVPVLYTSTDNGTTWSAPTLFSQGVSTNSGFNGVGCSTSGLACTIVGTNSTNDTLIGYTTTNGGSSWTSSNFSNPVASNFSIKGATCDTSGLNCVAVGYYSTTALTYTTTNGGAQWNYSLPSSSGTTFLNAVACSSNGLNCIAVGSKSSVPVYYTTTSGGVSWSAATQLTVTFNNTDKNITLANTGALNGVACSASGLQCVTVGSKNSSVPLTYTTSNGGSNWTQVLPTAPTLYASSTNKNVRAGGSALNSVACSNDGLTCIAVGFSTLHVPIQSIVYTTSNGGTSWNGPTYLPTPSNGDTTLNGITCDSNGLLCTAMGTTIVSGVTKGVSYSTTNSGATWQTPVVLVMPAGAASVTLYNVGGSK